jgi:hypothetical protein
MAQLCTAHRNLLAIGRGPIGYVNGRAVWPMLGGVDDPANPAPPAPPAPAAPTPPAPAPPTPPAPAFPPNTPVAEMTPEQRSAYDDFMKERNHRTWFEKTTGLSIEQLTELKTKAAAHDAIQLELGSEADRKAAEATKTAADAADAKYQPLLVKAEFRALAAGRLTEEQLTTILEPLDLSKFLAADGTPDTAKVKTYVDGIAPATGTQSSKKGPTVTGHGSGSGASGGGLASLSGDELYDRLHPKKTA